MILPLRQSGIPAAGSELFRHIPTEWHKNPVPKLPCLSAAKTKLIVVVAKSSDITHQAICFCTPRYAFEPHFEVVLMSRLDST